MRAALYTAPETLVVRDEKLKVCGPDDIIIKTHACGICGSDVRNYRSGLRADVGEQIPGHEFTGVVCETGSNVKNYRVGDRIAAAPDVSCGECWYCRQGYVNLCSSHRMLGTHWPGGFAEYVHLPEVVLRRGMIHHIPEGVSLTDAAISEPASSVIASHEDAGVSEGCSIVIFGTGPIGCLHAGFARAKGAAKVIMVGRRRLEMAKPFNPDHLLSIEEPGLADKIRTLTGGLGADVAVCANPAASTQNIAVESVRKRGTVVLFGGLPKTDPMTSLNSNTIHYGEIRVIGSFSYRAGIHRKALDYIKDGIIEPGKYFNKVVSLEDIKEGFNSIIRGEALKVLVMLEDKE